MLCWVVNCVVLCVCVREREREREICVCLCVFISVLTQADLTMKIFVFRHQVLFLINILQINLIIFSPYKLHKMSYNRNIKFKWTHLQEVCKSVNELITSVTHTHTHISTQTHTHAYTHTRIHTHTLFLNYCVVIQHSSPMRLADRGFVQMHVTFCEHVVFYEFKQTLYI